jgi:fucose permease
VLRLSVANAGYGIGAVIGPLLIIAVRPDNFPILFGGIAVVTVMLSTLTRGVHAPPLRAEQNQRHVTMMKSQRRPILLTFIAAYVFYVAVETSSSGWMAAQLHGAGYSESMGTLVTAGFWAGLAIGRVVGTPLYHRSSDKTLVIGGLGLAIVLGGCAFSGLLAPYAYPLMGLVIASVFPMGLIWYTVLCPNDSDGLALMILFMMAGGVIGPGVESLMVSVFSIHVVPLVIAAFALLDLAIFSSALRFKPLSAKAREVNP